MKKLILTETGKEVKKGDKIEHISVIDHPLFGKTKMREVIEVNQDTAALLIDHNILKVIDDEEPMQAPHPSRDMPYFISKLSMKTGWKYDKVAGILDKIDDINTGAALSIVLREVALDLDRQYKGNIKDCKEVWAVSLVSETVFKIPVNKIKHWGTFAAFRTEEDAKKALDFIVDFVDGEW